MGPLRKSARAHHMRSSQQQQESVHWMGWFLCDCLIMFINNIGAFTFRNAFRTSWQLRFKKCNS